MKTWIIIPAYNEEAHIQKVIKRIKSAKAVRSLITGIIVVDDGSKDETFEKAKKEDVFVLRHVVNMGKGIAVKTGIRFAIQKGAEAVVLLDGDGQSDPEEVPKFIEGLKKHDIVFGYRTFDKNMPFIKRFGNNFINFVTKVLYRLSLKDTQSGYRAFTTKVYPLIKWRSPDYSMESEMITNVGKHKVLYKEVPIKTIYSDKYKGTTVLDGVKIVFNMILWRIRD